MSLAAELNAATTLPLSSLLREATSIQHQRAESESFIAALMRGELDRSAYVLLARQHHCIYRALEQAGDAVADDPEAEAFVRPELARTRALEADLSVLAGPDWATDIPVLDITHEYSEHLTGVAPRWIGYYLAHAYTRYLGDLSGGQVVRTMLQRHYGLTVAELSFYSFRDIPKLKVYKDAYRSAMDDANSPRQRRPRSPANAARRSTSTPTCSRHWVCSTLPRSDHTSLAPPTTLSSPT